MDFTPIEGLKFSGVVSPFLNFDKRKHFTRRLPYTSFNNPNSISGYIEGGMETKLDEDRNDNYRLHHPVHGQLREAAGQT